MPGVTKGLQLMCDFLKLFFRAVAARNWDAVDELVVVGKIWVNETADRAGIVRVNPLSLLFSDPWQGSRAAYRSAAQKWSARV